MQGNVAEHLLPSRKPENRMFASRSNSGKTRKHHIVDFMFYSVHLKKSGGLVCGKNSRYQITAD